MAAGLPVRLLCVMLAAAEGSRDSSWCKDKDEKKCAEWSKGGECDRNPGFMKGYCIRSCDKCDMLDASEVELGSERVVLHTKHGQITLGLFPGVAPVTARHILRLFQLGCYETNHFFRVDKGFVAQIQTVVGGQRVVSPDCTATGEAARTVPGEFSKIRHSRGVLSMGRGDNPNSGSSSFSILLGDAPHLDEQYTVFGRLLEGDEALASMEKVETKRAGIFVMPVERIEISGVQVLHTDTHTVDIEV